MLSPLARVDASSPAPRHRHQYIAHQPFREAPAARQHQATYNFVLASGTTHRHSSHVRYKGEQTDSAEAIEVFCRAIESGAMVHSFAQALKVSGQQLTIQRLAAADDVAQHPQLLYASYFEPTGPSSKGRSKRRLHLRSHGLNEIWTIVLSAWTRDHHRRADG